MGDKALENLVRAASQGGLTRRAFLARAAAIGLSATVAGQILAACGGDEGDGGGGGGEEVAIAFCTYGGSFGKAIEDAWVTPYMAANSNVKIAMDEPTDYAKIQAMVEAENVTWDLVDVGNDFAIGDFEKLCEPLDSSVIPMDELNPEVLVTTGYRVPFISYSVVVAYRTDKFGDDPPTSFADFFDLKKYPGKRGVYNDVMGVALEIALVADGVDPAELYPLDMDRAYKKLDTIKDQIVWWDTGEQSVQLLVDGEISMGVSWNGRITAAAKEGAPITNMWDQHFLTADYLMIPKGSANVDPAMEFIAYMVSADHNAEIAKFIDYGPVNVNAADKVDPEVAKTLPSTYLDGALALDDIWWGQNRNDLTAGWQAWVQG